MSRGKITIQELDTSLKNSLENLQDSQEIVTKVKSGKDESGVYTTITYRRKKDGTLYATSVLSGGVSPKYTTRTITRFDVDGQTIVDTTNFQLLYDSDDNLVSEV